jgi:hypothetical protein
MSETAMVPANGGSKELAANMIAREEFGARELMRSAERAAVAQAAQAKAEVAARYEMALRRPRDWDQVRVEVKEDCKRLVFAKASRYKIPNRGEGWTIRFVEAVLQHMTNVYIPAVVTYEDDERRIVRVTPTDLESNVSWPKDITISKTIERYATEGREVVRPRVTSGGKTIFIVRATDDELMVKENSLVSKTARTNGQRLIPPDLLEECRKLVVDTIQKGIDADPDAERKSLADAFATLNVMPANLKEYLGTELGQVAPVELGDLRMLYTAIRDGQTTWRDVMAAKKEDQGEGTPAAGLNALKEKLRRSVGPQPAPVHPAGPTEPQPSGEAPTPAVTMEGLQPTAASSQVVPSYASWEDFDKAHATSETWPPEVVVAGSKMVRPNGEWELAVPPQPAKPTFGQPPAKRR